MAYYRPCERCGCSLESSDGLMYPGVGLVCEECSEELDLEVEYRKMWSLTKGQMIEPRKELLASPS